MAYALVGTIGTAVQTAAGSPLNTVTFGTGESRTAGNLLIFWVTVTASATLPGTPSGWSIGAQVAGTSCSATVYYKIAAGSDAAPTISAITSGLIAGQLAEFSGNRQVTPADRSGTQTATSNPVTATFGGADSSSGVLWVAAGADRRSVARASNDTWTGNHVTATAAGNNNGTSSQDHYSFAYANTTSNSGADTAVMTLSITTSITGLAVAASSFELPASVSATVSDTLTTTDSLIGPIIPYVPVQMPSLLAQ